MAKTNAQRSAQTVGTELEMPVPSAEVVAPAEEAGAREAVTASGGTDPHRASEIVASAAAEAIVRTGRTEAVHVTGIPASEAGMARETAMNEAAGATVSAIRTAPATLIATGTTTVTGIEIGIETIADPGPLAPMLVVASARAATGTTAEKAGSTIVVSVNPGIGVTRPGE